MKHDDFIRQMTLREKCSLLCGKDVWHTCQISRLGIPSITLSDGPSGLRKQAAAGDHLGLNESTEATCFPSPAAIANSWDMTIARRVGAAIGREAASQDVQVLLAPGLNIKRNPLCGRNFEYFSEDPYLSGKMAAAFVQGVQSQGVAACVKHFAVNNQETNRMHCDSVLDERTLREIYLTGFEIAVKEGKPKAVMTAYNKVNGTYANENRHLLQDILYGEWGYEGAVISDWGASNDIAEGVLAGMTLEMPGTGEDSACQLLTAVKQGKIAEETLDERVDKILSLILSSSPGKSPADSDINENHALARAAVEASVVLLKNENTILPLPPAAKVAILGEYADTPRYQGAGSSYVNPTKIDRTLDLYREVFPNAVGYAQGYTKLNAPDEDMLVKAESLAKISDLIVLYLGLPECFETEGMDRRHMRLPENQIALIHRVAKVNPHIIVVLSGGSAIELPWVDCCEAVLYASLLGQAGASAILNILSGTVCPSGKLAETFPISYEDIPSSRYFPGTERTSEYREGIFTGYRAFETMNRPVRYPFGFGLSYASFQYERLDITRDQVSFDITNIGKCEAIEIAQLYVSLPESQIFRAKLELKGFIKVRLLPGERKRAAIAFDDKTFRYFNVETKRFETEQGNYTILIGTSVQDIRLTGTLQVPGTTASLPYQNKEFRHYNACNIDTIPDQEFSDLLGHDLPNAMWDQTALLDMNDMVSQMVYARNPVARIISRFFRRARDRSIIKEHPDLNMLFLYSMPFRAMAKMTNGMISIKMVEDILVVINGHAFRGIGRLVRDYFRRPHLGRCGSEAERPSVHRGASDEVSNR